MNFTFLWRKPAHPAPVIVQTFKIKKTDLERLQDAKHRQLAKELGLPWPLRSAGERRVS